MNHLPPTFRDKNVPMMSSGEACQISANQGNNKSICYQITRGLLQVEINEFVRTSEELACQMHGCVTSYRKSMKLVLIIIGSNMPH